ncbi:MAG: antitoxin MazE-like protein [Geminicoccaceae bacterium]
MAKSAKRKISDYRQRMRQRGLRQVQFWVPDLRDPQVQAELRKEIRKLRNHPSTADGDMFLDAALAELAAELTALEGKDG